MNSGIANHGLAAGFADPVHDSQICFRAVLDAMSHPGRVIRVAGVRCPAPLDVATGAVLLALVDHETPLWLDPGLASSRSWIEFHCGVPVVTDPAGCAFAAAMTLPNLELLPAGSHESPETSATVICQIGSFGEGATLRLSGPGLREPVLMRASGLPHDFATIWHRNHSLFPRGIDLILCAGGQLTALPRTVAIEEV